MTGRKYKDNAQRQSAYRTRLKVARLLTELDDVHQLVVLNLVTRLIKVEQRERNA